MGKKGDKRKIGSSREKSDDDIDVPHDERFASVLDAPVFKNISKEKHKVEIDDRFKSMLTDDRFKVLPGGSVDAYGRKKKAKARKNELEDLYQVNKSESEDNTEGNVSGNTKTVKGKNGKPSHGKGNKAEMENRLDYLTKLARGEISDNESESDESDDEEEDEEHEIDDEDGYEVMEVDPEEFEAIQLLQGKSPLDVPEEEDVEMGEATRRISILNCDWDNIKADDLMVILQSFCPSGRQVHSVTVYPSDFGKQRMAEEAKYGPRGIWKEDEDHHSEDDDEDENGDENNSLYDQIETKESGDEEQEDDEKEGSDVEESEEVEEPANNSKSKGKKELGDFARKQGAVGLVMHDELVQRQRKKNSKSPAGDSDNESEDEEDIATSDNDDESGSENSGSVTKTGIKKKPSSDFNSVALRQYELSKLRYYFAIAECDSVETANALYEALDDVEFEHSAMALEIRFVPDDLDLSDREVRDVCSHSPDARSYKPPEFVVNAKQHTNVTCTWDEGEKDREKALTNFSAWRNLKESDFAQYLASESEESDNDEEEEDATSEDESEDGHNGGGNKSVKSTADKKKEKARAMRKMLLGDDGSSDDDSQRDDFFNESLDGSDNESEEANSKMMNKKSKSMSKASKDVNSLGENDELVMTYVPEADKDQILQRMREREGLTPYELEMQKSSDRKKARKAERKAQLEETQRQQKDEELMRQEELKKAKKQKRSRNGNQVDPSEDLDEEDIVESYRGRMKQQNQDLQKERKKKLNKKTLQTSIEDDLTRKHQQNSHRAIVTDVDFKVDTMDSRFAKVFEGDAKFGIDRTAPEFRATTGMKKILAEQRKRRHEEEESGGNLAPIEDHLSKKVRKNEDDLLSGKGNVDVNQLANKLKDKFQHRIK